MKRAPSKDAGEARRAATKTRAADARARAESRRARTRYYIGLNIKPVIYEKQANGRMGYRKFVWPKLFNTADEAWAFARAVNVFRNTAAIPGRGRIQSYSVETTVLPA